LVVKMSRRWSRKTKRATPWSVSVLAAGLVLSLLGTFGSAPVSAKSSETVRTPLALKDAKVVAAAEFARDEISKLCDSCAEDLKRAYAAITLNALKAESAPMVTTPGEMIFLQADVRTSAPCVVDPDWQSTCSGAESQTIEVVVFAQRDAGEEASALSFVGTALDRHPFLNEAEAWDTDLRRPI